MTPRREDRIEAGGRAEATARMAHARKFLEVAKLVADAEGEVPSSASVSASLAVLAGIAASYAACFAGLGRRSRGQSHHAAAVLLEKIEPGGKVAARSFRRLIDVKDSAQYGLIVVTSSKLKTVVRDASAVVDFADAILTR